MKNYRKIGRRNVGILDEVKFKENNSSKTKYYSYYKINEKKQVEKSLLGNINEMRSGNRK